MSFLTLPYELLLKIIEELQTRHINALARTNRGLNLLLSPILTELATRPENSILALCWAAVHRDEAMIINILENGPRIALMRFVSDDMTNEWQEKYCAPMENGRDAITFVVTCGPNLYIRDLEDPEAKVQDPESALLWAMRLGDVALVQILLKNGADYEGSTGWTRPIVLAARAGDLEVVRLLLEKETDHNARGQALETAMLSGHEAVVRVLLENGVDVNCRKYAKYTVLSSLVQRHCRDCVPLSWTEQSEGMLRLLLGYGADPTIPDRNRKSALFYAQRRNHQGILQVLSEQYPWNGAGTRPLGELKVVDIGIQKDGKQFHAEWVLRQWFRRTGVVARKGYRRVGKSLAAIFVRKK